MAPWAKNTHVFTTVAVPFKFVPYNPADATHRIAHEKIMTFFENHAFEHKEVFLHSLSRGLAGHTEDKAWINNTTLRHALKSSLLDLLKRAFGEEYITSFESGNLLKKGLGSDLEKQKSWLVKMQHCRLAFASEIKEGRVIDGCLLKSLTGNDPVSVRLPYQQQESFVRLQCRFVFLNNKVPVVEPNDAKERLMCLENYRTQYAQDEEERRKMQRDGVENALVYCFSEEALSSPAAIAALTRVFIDHYSTGPSKSGTFKVEKQQQTVLAEKKRSGGCF